MAQLAYSRWHIADRARADQARWRVIKQENQLLQPDIEVTAPERAMRAGHKLYAISYKAMLLFIIAVAVNYLWELAQAPLYVGLKSYNTAVFWHCFVASLGDGVMVVAIAVAGWITLHGWNWFEHPGVGGYVVMLAAGLVMAVLVEWFGVYVLGRWEYTVTMPTVPGLGIGLVPIAQMIILPPLIFRIAAIIESRTSKSSRVSQW